jgi:ATP synthase protein I
MAENAGTPDPSPLSELSSRLEAARRVAALDGEGADGQRGRALGQGFRLGSELLAAMIVGPLLGLGLDRFAGTAPWGLIGGIFLGFAAGVLNVSRAMKATAAKEADGKNESEAGGAPSS